MSLVNVAEAEWRTRKINVLSLLTGFLKQLSPGEDMTKVSLPAVILHPFSMLETIGQRELLTFHLLFELDNVTDPFKRFLIVTRWLISLVRTETLEKKPYNPVLGEYHLAWVINDKDNEDATEFVSEQVSHHPPVSAFSTRAIKHGLSLTCFPSFGVKFGTNSAGVTTAGAAKLVTPIDSYELTKSMPDMVVQNVIRGKRYISWTGEIEITCPDSGYVCRIKTVDKSKTNKLSGSIFKESDPDTILYNLEGVCGVSTSYFAPSKPDVKTLLIDHDNIEYPPIHYLHPKYRTRFESMEVWKNVNKAILDSDMKTADSEKKKVEAEQRVREAKKKEAGLMDQCYYFVRDPDSLEANWEFRDNLEIRQLVGFKNMLSLLSPGPNFDDPKSRLFKSHPTTGAGVSDFQESESDSQGSEPEHRPVDVSDHSNEEASEEEEIKENNKEASSTSKKSPPSSPMQDSITTSVADSEPEESRSHTTSSRSALTDDLPRRTRSKKRPRAASSSSARSTPSKSNLRKEMASRSTLDVLSALDDAALEESDSVPLSKKEAKKDRKVAKKELRADKKTILAKMKEQKKSQGANLIVEDEITVQGPIKVRNNLKQWKNRYAIVVRNRLIYFKDKGEFVRNNSSGIINLKGTYAHMRPSKKDGFCIKVFSVHDYPIYSAQNLKGKTVPRGGNLTYILIRLVNDTLGAEWLKLIRKAIPDLERSRSLFETGETGNGSESESSQTSESGVSSSEVPIGESQHSPSPKPHRSSERKEKEKEKEKENERKEEKERKEKKERKERKDKEREEREKKEKKEKKDAPSSSAPAPLPIDATALKAEIASAVKAETDKLRKEITSLESRLVYTVKTVGNNVVSKTSGGVGGAAVDTSGAAAAKPSPLALVGKYVNVQVVLLVIILWLVL
eukprot:TRINITY_DN685_c0_g1_i1.p1 TRINITY_DN685_c0_g1~~TRINITY_DN685_c0_g1_i1.p1  ORF type:complete len:932 (+),score=257.28 TRINITY_DN685_c0_g1_i1:84-2798(+)